MAFALLAAVAAKAEIRTYSYNVRGELVASGVSGGPADGVQTTTIYDTAGNRTDYRVSNSKAAPRFSVPVAVPLGGIKIIQTPQ